MNTTQLKETLMHGKLQAKRALDDFKKDAQEVHPNHMGSFLRFNADTGIRESTRHAFLEHMLDRVREIQNKDTASILEILITDLTERMIFWSPLQSTCLLSRRVAELEYETMRELHRTLRGLLKSSRTQETL